MQDTYLGLKSQQRELREKFNDSLGLRVHRAISWYGRAAQEQQDPDACFIFLWIAFNSAYACEFPAAHRPQERHLFNQFVEKICALDQQQKISELVWQSFSGAVRVLIDNQYVFEPFWQYQRGELAPDEWKSQFVASKNYALQCIGKQDISGLLDVVFSRLYTLRNQLMHGGATWNSSINRNQVKDGVAIMARLVPVIIEIMMQHPQALWGNGNYPPIKD